jgi:hypothetical protein
MAMASRNGRTPEIVRQEIEIERQELEAAVEQLRGGLGGAVSSTFRARLPVVAVGALGAGFFLAGGIGATMRFLARKGRER